MKTQVRSLKTQVRSLKTQVRSLKTQVRLLKTQVRLLKTQVRLLKTQVRLLKTQVRLLKTQVRLLKTQVCSQRFVLYRRIITDYMAIFIIINSLDIALVPTKRVIKADKILICPCSNLLDNWKFPSFPSALDQI